MGLSDFWDSIIRGAVAIFGGADRLEALQGSPTFGTVSGRGGASGCRSVGGQGVRVRPSASLSAVISAGLSVSVLYYIGKEPNKEN